MPYLLGIDVGTSHTSAALCTLGGPMSGAVEMVPLGDVGKATPSTLYLPGDGSVVVGATDPKLAIAEPQRMVSGFSRRVGDDVPVVVDGVAYDAAELTAALIVWVTEQLASSQGEAAEHVVVTHPASWGPHRRHALTAALREVELAAVTLLPEPIAVGESYARHETLDPGDAVAMYGLGGDWCYGAVIRRTTAGTFALLGHAEDSEPGGGQRVDDAVLDWLRTELAEPLGQLDPGDPRSALIMARIRQDCRTAKERLSEVRETTVDVHLPNGVYAVPLTRRALEALARPLLAGTVDTLLRAVRMSGVDAGQLTGVALVGGAARMPLVADLVSARLPCRIVMADDPRDATAIGAALAGYRRVTGKDAPAAVPAGALVLAGGPRDGNGHGQNGHGQHGHGNHETHGPGQALGTRDGIQAGNHAGHPVAAEHSPTEIIQRIVLDDDDEPPARPAPGMDPLDLPRRRTLGVLDLGARPIVTSIVSLVLVAAIVTLTFLFQAHTSSTSGRTSSSTPTATARPGPTTLYIIETVPPSTGAARQTTSH